MRRLVGAFVALLAVGALPAHAAGAPAHDAFAQAVEIGSIPFDVIAYDLWEATSEAGEPSGCFGVSRTIWYRYTPTADQDLIADTHVAGTHNRLVIYTGTTFEDLVRIACASSSGYDGARIAFHATAGTTYWFQISNLSAWSWFAGLYLVAERPGNDDFGTASVVPSLPHEVTQATIGATHQTGDRGCYEAGWYGRGVWYRFTTDAAGRLVAETTGSDYRTIISVFTGATLGASQFVGCSGYTETLPASIAFDAAAATTYSFHIHNNYQQTGNLRFKLRMVPPANDLFSAAFPLSTPFRGGIVTTLASTEAGEPLECGENTGATVWWRYAPETDERLVAEVTGSDFDAVLALYEGSSPSTLQQVACGENGSVDATVHGNRVYYVQVGGRDGATGRVTLELPRFASASYEGIVGAVLADPCEGQGGVCFDRRGSAVDLTVNDSRADPAAARYRFVRVFGDDAFVQVISSGVFCGAIEALAIPPAATRLEVMVSATVIEAGCGDGLGGLGGSVDAVFRA